MKFLKIPLLVLLTLLVLVAVAAAWILGTRSGTAWVFERAAAFSPQPLTANIRGALARTLVLTNVRYGSADGGLILRADRIRLQLDLMDLLHRALHIQHVHLENVSLTLTETEQQPRQRQAAEQAFDLRPPIDIVLDELRLREAVVRRDGEPMLEINTLRMNGQWTEAGVDVDTLALNAEQGHLSISGRLEHERTYKLQTQGTFRWRVGDTTLAGTLHGSARGDSIDARVRLSEPAAASVALEGEASRRHLHVQHLNVRHDSGHLAARGRITFEPQLSWNLEANASQLNPGVFFPQWPGSLRFALSTTGRLSEGQPQGELHIDELQGQLRNHPITGMADLTWAQGMAPGGELRLRSGDTHLLIDADPGKTWDVTASVAVDSLSAWAPEAGGSLQGEFSITGSWPDLNVAGSARAADIDVGPVSIASAQLRADIENVRTPSGQAHASISDATMGQYSIESARADLSGSREDHRIEIDVAGEPVSLSLTATGEALGKSGWRETLRQLALTAPAIDPLSLKQPATLVVTDGTIDSELFCLANEQMRLCGALRTTKAGALSARYEIHDLPLELLASLAPATAALQVAGSIDGEGNLRRDPEGQLFGQLMLRSAGGELTRAAGTDVKAQELLKYRDLRANVQLEGSQATASLHGELEPAGQLRGQIAVSGLGTTTRPIDGEIAANIPDLSPLSLLSLQVANVDGSVQLTADVDGTLSSPEIAPRLRATDLAFDLPALGIRLHDGTLRAAPGAENFFDLDGRIESGEGCLTWSGRVSQDGTLQLDIDGQQFTAANLPGARVIAAPDLHVQKKAERWEITGDLFLPSATINIKKLPRVARAQTGSDDIVIVDARTQRQRARQQDKEIPLHADIDVRLGEDVTLSGFGLQADVSGEVSVSEAPGEPTTGSGELRVSGTYKAYGQDLTIAEGSLIYANTPLDNPALRVVAVREIDDDVTAGLRIAGTARSPQLSVFSDPAMDDANALSYLVAGRPLDSIGEQDGDALQSAARSLGAAAGRFLSKRIGGRLGLDTVTVEESEALDGAAFTVGEYLSPRLYLSYGVGLFEPGDVVTLRYRLTDELALRALRGPNDARAGIEYRLEK